MAMEPLVLGRLAESFHQVVASVVAEVLTRLGHSVVVVDGLHEEMYAKLGRGELDLFADSWLPHSQGMFWEPIKDRAVEVGELFTGARYFWAVPCHVAAHEVTELSDLAHPDVIAEMASLEIVGAPAQSGLSRWSEKALAAYGLAEAGWTYRSADVAAVIRTVNERMAAGEWFVTPLWVPQYLDDVFDMRRLQDPQRVFPPPDRASIVAWAETFERLPDRTKEALGRIQLSPEHVSAMDAAVNLDGLTPREAALDWMDEYAGEVKRWLRC